MNGRAAFNLNYPTVRTQSDMSSRPLVSIVVPAYNAAETLDEMIVSVMRQTIQDFELVICDDASTDETTYVISRHNDNRIRLLSNSSNSGEGAARDLAISASTGKWLAVLDADDAWRPNRLEKLLNATHGDNNVLVFDNIMICHHTAKGMVEWLPIRSSRAYGTRRDSFIDVPLEDYIRSERLLIKPLIPRKKLMDSGITHSRRKFGADTEFFIRLGLAGFRFRYIPQALYFYRVTPGSATEATKGNEHLMRECLECLIPEAENNSEARIALEAKISALHQQEKLYTLARSVTDAHIFDALAIIRHTPKLLLRIPKIALRRILYNLHRALNS